MPEYLTIGRLAVGNLGELECANISKGSQDGETWHIREKGKDDKGYRFLVKLSDRERNRTPGGWMPIERPGFPTPEEIKKAIKLAIEDELVSAVYENIKPGVDHPVDVTCFHLYKAAGR